MHLFNKLWTIAILAAVFIFSSCQTGIADDGLREVYFEVNAKGISGNPSNYIIAELWRLESDGSVTAVDLDIREDEAPVIKQSSTIIWEKGKTIRLELRSGSTFWCEADVKVYSNSKIIFEKTFYKGESGSSQDNYFKFEVE
ncbi:hypothetical protein N9B83_00565 [Schleiferiaceae bacterium]|mgnify:CR=1 FL=1|nr:hypothetical protein [Schleiferiaceae bacterium]